jgi:hypothetical protein
VEEEIEDKDLDELDKKDLEGLLMMDVDGEVEEGDDEGEVGLREFRIACVEIADLQYIGSKNTYQTRYMNNTKPSVISHWTGSSVSV